MEKRIEQGIIEWEDLQENVLDCLMFSGVKFISDFGPFLKGETADAVAFDFEKSSLESYDESGKVLKSCFFRLEPVV